MSFARTSDGVRLFYESAGSGTPIIFVHEFGGSHWSWEPQLNFFARRHRCITFAARGYPPSDIPESVEAYSQTRAADDIVDVLSAAGTERAHVVGLSMGGFAKSPRCASSPPARIVRRGCRHRIWRRKSPRRLFQRSFGTSCEKFPGAGRRKFRADLCRGRISGPVSGKGSARMASVR